MVHRPPSLHSFSNSYASGKQSDEEREVGCFCSQSVPNTVKGGEGGMIGKGGGGKKSSHFQSSVTPLNSG